MSANGGLGPMKRSAPTPEGEEQTTGLDTELNPARNYPRKRVAIACDVCRLRKTRCDAKRPCGFCTEAGIECVYRQQNHNERQTAAADILVRIEERLGRLEDAISTSSGNNHLSPSAYSGSAPSPAPIPHRSSIDPALSTHTPVPTRRPSHPQHPNPYAPPSVPDQPGSTTAWRSYYQQAALPTRNPPSEFAFRQTAGEAVTPRPSFTSFQCPNYISFDSWDTSEQFYDEEFAADEDLMRQVDDVLSTSSRGNITSNSHAAALHQLAAAAAHPDQQRGSFGQPIPPLQMSSANGLATRLRGKAAWKLQQDFLKNYLNWVPLLDVSELVQHVQNAQRGGFSENNPSTCLSLMAFAIAEIMTAESEARSEGLPQPMNGKSDRSTSAGHTFPGIEFFAHGFKMMKDLGTISRRNVTVLQCRVLVATYFHVGIRPLLAWDTITELARDCMHIISSSIFKGMDKRERENFHRVFWICSIILHELESILKTHPMGLRQFHEVVPLPLTETEEEGFYFFFAQVSLRKLLTETLDVVGYRAGQVIYAPVVTTELRKQSYEWYDHLPPHVRFSINGTPLFDLRKGFLRIQYIAIHMLSLWPSLLNFLESEYQKTSAKAIRNHAPTPPSAHHLRPTPPPTAPRLHPPPDPTNVANEEVSELIRHCTLCIQISEELLIQRHLGIQFALWACYASTCMLLITYRLDALAHVPQTLDPTFVQLGYGNLKAWDHLPVVRQGIARTRKQMKERGIRVPGEDGPLRGVPNASM